MNIEILTNKAVYLGPGVLSLVIFLFLNMMLWMTHGSLLAHAGSDAAMFVMESLSKIRQASLAVLLLGILLIALSYWGTRRKGAAPDHPRV